MRRERKTGQDTRIKGDRVSIKNPGTLHQRGSILTVISQPNYLNVINVREGIMGDVGQANRGVSSLRLHVRWQDIFQFSVLREKLRTEFIPWKPERPRVTPILLLVRSTFICVSGQWNHLFFYL